MEQGHALARDQLQEIADASEGSFEKLGETIDSSGAYITFRITLPFQGIERVLGGIPVNAREQFLIRAHKTFPFETPVVYVPHRPVRRLFACARSQITLPLPVLVGLETRSWHVRA